MPGTDLHPCLWGSGVEGTERGMQVEAPRDWQRRRSSRRRPQRACPWTWDLGPPSRHPFSFVSEVGTFWGVYRRASPHPTLHPSPHPAPPCDSEAAAGGRAGGRLSPQPDPGSLTALPQCPVRSHRAFVVPSTPLPVERPRMTRPPSGLGRCRSCIRSFIHSPWEGGRFLQGLLVGPGVGVSLETGSRPSSPPG